MQVLKISGLDSILSCLLKWSRETFSEHNNCEGGPINANLEWFYEVLISPVAHFLDDMKQEDKLIIVAPEVCSYLHGTFKMWCESLVSVDSLQLRICDLKISCCRIENT
jgi:hypothetical protein